MNETKRSFNVRKALLGLLALALVAAISVTATLAYLQQKTSALTNTFVAINGLLDTTTDNTNAYGQNTKGKFALYEHKLVGTPGNYTLAGDDTNDNLIYGKAQAYSVVPGVNVPKDPTIRVENILSDVLVYVEIVDGQKISTVKADDALSYTVESHWKKLDGVKGAHGGTLYAYIPTVSAATASKTDDAKISYADYSGKALTAKILANDEIVVGGNVMKDTVDGSKCKLEFYGYLTQYAGFAGQDLATVATANNFTQP